MGRWRDAKQGRKTQSKPSPKQENIAPSFTPCASLFTRFKAFTTDSFLIATPIIYIVMYLIMGGGDNFAANLAIGWLFIFIIHIPIMLFFWIKKGQSPGMKAYELKIVHAQTQGKISFMQAFVRYATTTFAIVSIFLIFLPYFRKDRRTFQDLFSNTILIDE